MAREFQVVAAGADRGSRTSRCDVLPR